MQEKETISLDVESLEEGCCGTSCPQMDQFLSNIFIVKMKDGGNRPVINLKESNQYIPFLYFKRESLQSLKTLLQKNKYICKPDLKDAYFCVLLSLDNRKSDVSIRRNSVPISMLVVWPCTSPMFS